MVPVHESFPHGEGGRKNNSTPQVCTSSCPEPGHLTQERIFAGVIQCQMLKWRCGPACIMRTSLKSSPGSFSARERQEEGEERESGHRGCEDEAGPGAPSERSESWPSPGAGTARLPLPWNRCMVTTQMLHFCEKAPCCHTHIFPIRQSELQPKACTSSKKRVEKHQGNNLG